MSQTTDPTYPSYGRALLDTLTDLGPGEIAVRVGLGAAAVASLGWLSHLNPFWGGLALGVALAGAGGSLVEVLVLAARRMRYPNLWYSPGRRVFALNLGDCEVLDYDDRPELQGTVWVLLLPVGEDTAVWAELDPRHIASTGRELAQRRACEES